MKYVFFFLNFLPCTLFRVKEMFGLLTSIVSVSKLDAIGTLAIFRIIFSQNDRRSEKPTKNRKKTETFLEQRFLEKSMFYV